MEANVLLHTAKIQEQKHEIMKTYHADRTTYEVLSTFTDDVSLTDVIFRNALQKITQRETA